MVDLNAAHFDSAPICSARAVATPRASTRDRLLALISSQPGIHKKALCDAAGVAWGTVDYHLGKLHRHGLIGVRKVGRTLHCFPGGDAPASPAPTTLLVGHGPRIAEVLRQAPGQGLRGISDVLGLSPKVVRRHLVRMLEAGVAERHGRHRPIYRLHPDAQAAVESPTRTDSLLQSGIR